MKRPSATTLDVIDRALRACEALSNAPPRIRELFTSAELPTSRDLALASLWVATARRRPRGDS